MNPLRASHDRQKTNSASLSERERFLDEYAQAIDSYQKATLALQEAVGTLDTETVKYLLAQADAAKEAVQQYRDQYLSCCALTGTSPLRATLTERNPSRTPSLVATPFSTTLISEEAL